MILFYLLVPHCIYLWYSTTFYQPTAYTDGTLLSSTGQCLYQWNSAIFYWRSANPYITLLSSTGSQPLPMVLYYLLLLLCLLYYLLLAPSLYLWYSTTFFWPTAYSTTFYWHPAYTYATLLFLLAHCLYLWFFTTVYWPAGYTMYRLYLWYSITFYWPPADLYGTLLTPAGSLHSTLVLFHRLLATAFTNETLLSLLAPCLSLWYSIIFYWPTAYHYGTLLLSSGPLPTLLSSTGSMPITMVLYYLHLAHFLCLCYSTIFYWTTAYTYVTLLSSTGSLPN